MVKRRLPLLLALIPLALMLEGCPANTSQRQQVAQAVHNASIIVKGFEEGEIAARDNGRQCLSLAATDVQRAACVTISDADHEFIQRQMQTIALAGKAADGCVGAASSSAGIVSCVNSAIGTIDQVNNQGGLSIKSPQAKQDFQIAMLGARTALSVISTILGQPTAPATSPALGAGAN